MTLKVPAGLSMWAQTWFNCGEKFWEWLKYWYPQSLLLQFFFLLYFFARCFYGILKYNYKHLISVEDFNWQLHKMYGKSQYLQCWPFFFKTSAIHPGMLSINFLETSRFMATHSCIISGGSLSEFVGFCLSTHLLKVDHKFSEGLGSEEFAGHGLKILMVRPHNHLVVTFALCAPSYWKKVIVHQQTVHGWLEDVALGGGFGTILFLFLCF